MDDSNRAHLLHLLRVSDLRILPILRDDAQEGEEGQVLRIKDRVIINAALEVG